jgi:hypothetical protein
MTRFITRRWFLSAMFFSSLGILSAQEVTPVVDNVLWRDLPPPTGDPATAGQFSGFSSVSSSAPTQVGMQRPASGELRLRVSFLGASVSAAPPEFALGDIIGTPLAVFPNADSIPISLRREPVRGTEAAFKYRFDTDDAGVVRDFTPSTEILGERYFWSPHARFGTQPDPSTKFEEITAVGTPGSLTRDGFVYAAQGGTSRIFWRTTSPIGVDDSNLPVYGLVERVVNVSTASRLPVRRIFWTENGFQGQPVQVPRGEVQQVRIAFNDSVPEQVPEGMQYPSGSEIPATRRTIWHDSTLDSLHAYNREGRVLIEFLGEARTGGTGLRRQVGVEVVDIIQEALPSPVELAVGDRLFPLPPDQSAQQAYPLPPPGAARDAVMNRISGLLAAYAPRPVLSTATPPFTRTFTVAGEQAFYATRATTSASDVMFFWTEPGIADIRWPKFLNRYRQYWPDDLVDYAVNVRPSDADTSALTPPVFGQGTTFELVHQDNDRALTSNPTDFVVDLSGGYTNNRSLLLVSSGDHFWFLRVESVLDTFMAGNPRYSSYYRDTQLNASNQTEPLTAFVGRRINAPAGADSSAGYVDLAYGDAIDPTAYLDPFSEGIPEAEAGSAIIPVNAAPKRGSKTNDRLAVWWFKKVDPPAALAGRIAPIYWPSFYSRYQLAWPLDAPQIVLASNAGSGDLPADAAAGTIYFENDPAKIGYNPNEEHALMITGRAYALRDDLNTPQTSSSPYVLVRYTNAVDKRPDMRAFRVLRENETYTFTYDARAGTVLQPPMPLAVMPPPLRPDGTSRNLEVTPANLDPAVNIPVGGLGELAHYNRFTYEDRKGLKWIYRGQHNPTANLPALGMKFYYATLDGFAYPNAITGIDEAPALGTLTPFLHDGLEGDTKTGTSITVGYRPYWPDRGTKYGIKAEYFNNTEVSGAPALTRLDPTVDFFWAAGTSPAPQVNTTNFSARWTGYVIIPRTGEYSFHIETDQGSRFWLGNTDADPINASWSAIGGTNYSSQPRRFEAGQRVPVRFEFLQTSGSAVARLQWTGPNIAKSVIPQSTLLPADTDAVEVPSLQFAETLVKPKFGLPGLDGASSAHILYQQSVARNVTTSQESAVLHDPTRNKIRPLGGALPKLPDSIVTSGSGSRIYFQGLPAHLQERFFLDPALGTGNPPSGALVLQGKFVDEIVGDDYIQMNVLTATEIAIIKDLVAANDPAAAAWRAAVDALNTTLETFVEDPPRPGTYIPDPRLNRDFGPRQLVRVTHRDQAVDSYALTAVGGGDGYVTLLLGDGDAFTDSSEPIQMHILRVGPQLYRGQVKPLSASNPLAENLTLQHTGDFAAQEDLFEFEWYYVPPVNGQPPVNRPGEPGATWFAQSDHDGPRVMLGGSQPLLMLTDNYFVMRHRPIEGHTLRPVGSNWSDSTGWSQWTDPALAEGWIKRVLAGINPFNQRFSDFFNNGVNTDVSLLTQAGSRWEGNIPLTLNSAQNEGLISIYETVLRRGMSFTIEGTPGINYGPANDALLLAAGYLNDLYMALGNEAYADAANPLISLDVDPQRLLLDQGLPASIGTTIQTTATARFAFEGQVPTLLDEELGLLRGRDDFLVPNARTSPFYNRLIWNYTRGINAGEVIYALNYNITEKAGLDADGKIDASDAARMFPQGHGDAYGHYLTALKNYYRLLANPNFTWTPRVEAVNILGVPVTVDYQDERKLATAAVSLARTASRLLDLERRKLPLGSNTGWSALRETKTNTSTGITRAWGMEQWASRAGQGNFLHWAAVNAILPENDLANEGLQKIDRTTVAEIQELAALGAEIQSHLDGANRKTNALNLTAGSMLFDLSPADLGSGQSHFDQVLAKAKAALANAATAHARTVDQNALLRSVENQAADYSFTVDRQEWAFLNQLYDIYGMPYPGDIGPGKTYPQGYADPDYFNYMFISRPYVYSQQQLFGVNQANNFTRTYQLPVRWSTFESLIAGFDGETGSARKLSETDRAGYLITNGTTQLTYKLNLNEGPYQIAPVSMGTRPFLGSVQHTLAEVMKSREDLAWQLQSLQRDRQAFGRQLARLAEDIAAGNRITDNERTIAKSQLALDKAIGAWEIYDETLDGIREVADIIFDAGMEGLPLMVGFSNDVTSGGRSLFLLAKATAATESIATKTAARSAIYGAQLAHDLAELRLSFANSDLAYGVEVRAHIAELEASYRELFSGMRDIDLTAQALDAALSAYQNERINGETILAERETFRKRAAAVIQGARTRDVAFRAFRTETLEQYKILFDQAARYTYLAAQAYDYETGQLDTAAGRKFLEGIVATRALGLVGPNGEPMFGGSSSGDPGLSSYLAKLEGDWNVAKGRLGINNPDQYGTLFSLRREFYGLPYREDGSDDENTAWQDRLRASVVRDLRTDRTIAAHALPMSNPTGLAQPGIVIDLTSVIESGLNFFGNPLAAGDSSYSSASYATKIHSVGVAFMGYQGMNPFTSGNTGVPGEPTHSHPDALAATPYVYLIPAGMDVMRTPPLGGMPPLIREWNVHDHAMPLPFDIGSGGFGAGTMWTGSTSLSEPFYMPRKHQPFRAVDNPALFYSTMPAEFTNRRLIGRSAWNTRWKLVIPAQTLLADPEEGLDRFIRSVKDVKLFLRTYSHAGN